MTGLLVKLGRIRVRLLAVNLVLVLVPVAGLEFARLYERQLLSSLERDMQNQAVLLRSLLESNLESGRVLTDAEYQQVLMRAARRTRTRIRLIDPEFTVTSDSHRYGPPEGAEPPPPALARGSDYAPFRDTLGLAAQSDGPAVALRDRRELKWALGGTRATTTRLRANPAAVLLFLAEPVKRDQRVAKVIYVTRSTQPVLVELHRIRSGLLVVLAVAVASTTLLTLLLAWTLTRPIEKLARAARQITQGHREVRVPVGGGGELTELGLAFQEMTQQLQARQRYISEFAADVAHEFKSPLTSIRGAAELLAEGAADDPVTRERFLRNILLDTERLNQLVTRLLELSRIEASEEPLRPTELAEVARRAVERCESPDQPINLVVDEAPNRIIGRPTDIETALLNLLDNALRYSPVGRPILVQIHASVDRRCLGLTVADEGPGILDEHQSRLFDRFFTTNGEAGGTGLGLSIVATVARAHAARVEVASKVGQGARFTIWFSRVP